MKREVLARGVFAALVFCPSASHAAEAPDIITVTAGRTAPLEALGGSVIGRADLDALAAPTALDALDRLAGVRAFSKGGVGAGSYLSIRGGEPNFTLVLLDGARVSDPTNSTGGGFDFSQLDPALIDRIEVYKGALSAVQGSDALSGVVNVRLRDAAPGKTGGTARLLGSTYGEVGGDASLSLGWKAGGLLLAGGGYDSGGLTRGSGLEREQGLARLTQTAGPAQLSLTGLYARIDRIAFPEDSGGPRLAVNRLREMRGSSFGLVNFAAGPADPQAALKPELRLSWSRQTANADTPAIARGVLSGVPAITADTQFDQFEAQGSLRYSRGPLSVAGGGGYIDEDGRATGAVNFGFRIPADFQIARGLGYGFGEASLTGERYQLTGGLRYDSPSHAGGRLTGRAAGRLVPVAGGPALFASYAEGFKLPSLYALAYPLIANPNLRPERATSYEAGLEQRWGKRARLRLSAFRTDYRDLIDFDAKLFTNVNRSRVRAEGVEAEGAAAWGAFLLSANLGYLDVTNADGPPLRYRPDWQGSARIDWRPKGPVSAFVALDALSDFFDLSVPTGQVRLKGRTTLDLGGSAVLGKGVKLDLVLRNATAARYEETIGFPAPRTGLRATLSAAF